MSAASISSSPLLESAFAVVAKMSRDEKAVLLERVEAELRDDAGVPDWENQVVQERLRLLDEGISIPIPWEQVKTRLGRKWGKK